MKMLKIRLAIVFAALCLFLTGNAFALTVNTADIADGAVTTPKIADGAITTNKVTDGSVTSGKIADNAVTSFKVSDGAITTNKVVDGAVATGKIADGAVTDAKITGPISASKISSTGLNADTVDGIHAADLAPAVHTHGQSQVTGLEAALAGKSDVNHNHDALYQRKYGKVAVVAQSGGDYTSPVSALNDLGTWCGSPSETNRCLLKIMSGIYVENVTAAPYVDIRGSSRSSTKIKGTLTTSNDMILSDITVENDNWPALEIVSANFSVYDSNIISHRYEKWAIGIYNNDGNVTIENVFVLGGGAGIYFFNSRGTVEISKTNIKAQSQGIGGHYYGTAPVKVSFTNIGIADAAPGVVGIYWYGGGLSLDHVTIDTNNFAVRTFQGSGDSKITCNNCSLTSLICVNDGDVYVNNSEVRGGIDVAAGGTMPVSLSIGNSLITGSIFHGNNATIKIVNSYDNNYDPIPNGNY